MALLVPLFMLLLLITVDFGRLFATQIAITNAAREGAYYASQPQHQVNGATGATAAAQLEAPGSTVTLVSTTPIVVVSVSQPFTFWTPFLSDGFPPIWSGFGVLTISATASGAPL